MAIQSAPGLLDIGEVLGSFSTRVEALVIASVIIGLGLMILNVVAVFKIITKAGYSGWWMLVVVGPLVILLVGGAIISNAARTNSASFNIRAFVVWLVVDGVSIFAQWIFFLVFAFSDWPVRRQLRRGLHVPMVPVAPNPLSHPNQLHHPQAPSPTVSTPVLVRAGLRCPYCGEPTNPETRICLTCGPDRP